MYEHRYKYGKQKSIMTVGEFKEKFEVKGNHEELLDSAFTSISGTIETFVTLMNEGHADE